MTHRLPPIVSSLVLVAFLGTLAAGPAPAEEEGAPTVVVRPLEGGVVTGRLLALDERQLGLKTDESTRTFSLGEVLDVRVTGTRSPSLGSRPHLRVGLTGGEILEGVYAGPVEGGIVLDTPDCGRVAVVLDVVRTIVGVPPDAGPCFEPEHRYTAQDDDTVYVQSGDKYEGIVLSVDDEGFEVETRRGRSRRIPWNQLLVAHLQNELPAAPEGVVVEIETVEGARLVASGAITLDAGALVFTMRSSPKQGIRLPLDRVGAIRPSGGAFVYASDLPFESRYVTYYHESDLARWDAVRADRRRSGCPLRIAGRTYRHGFAVHSRSFVTLEPAKKYRRFEALFGVDDAALVKDMGGIVDARVVGDGVVLWEAKDVRAGEPPRTVGPLDIAQVKVLVLVVDFGAETNILDRAAWVEPRFVR